MSIHKLTTTAYVTTDDLDDARAIREIVAVEMFVDHPRKRYHGVYRAGYWAALEDIRAGRLVFRDGEFVAGRP